MAKSIPIAKGMRAPKEDLLQHDIHSALIADYKDYVFYDRVVKGMRRRQDRTRDIILRYENQALIDHIVRMRHTQEPLLPHPISINSPTLNRGLRRVKSSANLLECLSSDSEGEWEISDEEDLIFDIEL